MKSIRVPFGASARLLIVASVVVALVGSAGAPRVLAAAAVPLAKLSLSERLRSAPDSTIVQLGPRTTTLGQLRAAHRAREAALLRARSTGIVLRGKLTLGNVAVVAQPFVEPPSQYASTPADMRAFCAAAQASACLYLPPDQQVTAEQAGVSDWDSLVTQSQCAQEGGTWSAIWSDWFCAFNYPASVTVHFTPAANFKLAQSANCDRNTFAYKVDNHGAITISLSIAMPVIMTTGNNMTCVVSVTPG
jgi:hypothetical protein